MSAALQAEPLDPKGAVNKTAVCFICRRPVSKVIGPGSAVTGLMGFRFQCDNFQTGVRTVACSKFRNILAVLKNDR